MTRTRRDVLKSGLKAGAAAVASATGWPAIGRAAPIYAPMPGAWRTFELVTRVEVAKPGRAMQAWLPVPAHTDVDWVRPGASTWTSNAPSAVLRRAAGAKSATSGVDMLHVVWAEGEPAPVVELTSRITTRDRGIDLSKPGKLAPLDAAERERSLAATVLLPTDGIVKETAEKACLGARTDIEKARALYHWVIENSVRDGKTRGCGLGDIASMLQSGNLSGKCADLNALFVGLARAAGVPARDLYGLRVAASRFGYKSLGPTTDIVTKAQHCRAEVFLEAFGWVAVDPADVRKVVLEEPPGQLALDDAKVAAVRHALFGAAEGNWLVFNTAHDIELPGAKGPDGKAQLGLREPFFMYPLLEVDGLRIDPYSPDLFRYTITAREIAA